MPILMGSDDAGSVGASVAGASVAASVAGASVTGGASVAGASVAGAAVSAGAPQAVRISTKTRTAGMSLKVILFVLYIHPPISKTHVIGYE
jgi:hypothetical protein